jgi:hypothetical protein
MMVWAVLQSFGLLVDRRAVGSGGPFFVCYCFSSLLFGWYVVLCWRCKCKGKNQFYLLIAADDSDAPKHVGHALCGTSMIVASDGKEQILNW